MVATHSLLGRSQALRPNSSGHRLPVPFLVLFLTFVIVCISLFCPLSDLRYQSPNSDPNTFNADDHINPIPWSSMNQTQKARVQTYISNQTEVAFTIMKQLFLSTEAKNKNMVYSPLSIHMVLSLLAAGSNGPTQDQLLTFLRSKSTQELNYLASTLMPLFFAKESPNGGPSLSFTNGAWVDKSLPVKPSFKQVVDAAYRAALKQVDFNGKSDEVRMEVNSWAEKETNGRIKDILASGSVDSLTRLILANALYFKGDWKDSFDALGTKEYDFHLLNGNSVKAPFMTEWITSWGRRYISVFDSFKVLKLPYKQGEDREKCFSMYVFLPNERDGLPALVERFSSESGFLDRHLPRKTVEVGAFKMPKFTYSCRFEASKVLKTLGLELPFVPGGFTEMVDSPMSDSLYVSHIQHGSFIDVNEDGTEAAAVTVAVQTGSTWSQEKRIDFVADHPFLFLIREETTGSVLFIGQVLNPIED
ncbi:serpin-ZX-like [Rosa rugosa]|uniref:serpin-ZX-like n=1 Tax=Rosa rugosa TaxID=74645 RepID=UPI002B4148FE|nr:serpin-ZX-like [Rosa rugosa]